MGHEPAWPLRNLPIQIYADGKTVFGIVRHVRPNDMDVEIVSPFRDLRTQTHVPHFAMYRPMCLATSWDASAELTERGQKTAERLLRCLYEHACGRPTGWGVEERRNGEWVRVEPGV